MNGGIYIRSIIKINSDIEKAKIRLADTQELLKKLEREKIQTENFEIVMLVRGMDITADKLKVFAEIYKQENEGAETAPGKEQDET